MVLPDEHVRVCFSKPLRNVVLVPQLDAVDRGYFGYVRGKLVDRSGTHLLATQFRGNDKQFAPLIKWDLLAKDTSEESKRMKPLHVANWHEPMIEKVQKNYKLIHRDITIDGDRSVVRGSSRHIGLRFPQV